VLWLAPALAAGQGAASGPNAADERAIVRLQEDWFKAFDAADADATARIETDDFTVSGEFGVFPKDRHLAGIRSRHDAGPREASGRKIDDRQFRFHGDTALITQVDRYPDGRAYQDTQVWLRSGGSWKIAHLHFTQLAKKP
jgi:ketosteroid isomerase-like protein